MGLDLLVQLPLIAEFPEPKARLQEACDKEYPDENQGQTKGFFINQSHGILSFFHEEHESSREDFSLA
jgi:hypothetical protein